MAKPKKITSLRKKNTVPKRTSIGKSRRSKPKNKHKKANWKPYRGQGK